MKLFLRVGSAALLLWFLGGRLLSHPQKNAQGDGQPPSKGTFVVRSNKPNATFFYRPSGTSKWRYVDCSPQIIVGVSAGRYEVKIEGAGGRMLLPPRVVEVRKDLGTIITAPNK